MATHTANNEVVDITSDITLCNSGVWSREISRSTNNNQIHNMYLHYNTINNLQSYDPCS